MKKQYYQCIKYEKIVIEYDPEKAVRRVTFHRIKKNKEGEKTLTPIQYYSSAKRRMSLYATKAQSPIVEYLLANAGLAVTNEAIMTATGKSERSVISEISRFRYRLGAALDPVRHYIDMGFDILSGKSNQWRMQVRPASLEDLLAETPASDPGLSGAGASGPVIPPPVPSGNGLGIFGSDCEPYCANINKIVYENALLFGKLPVEKKTSYTVPGRENTRTSTVTEREFQDDYVRFVHTCESEEWDSFRVYINKNVWNDVPPYLRAEANTDENWNLVYQCSTYRDIRWRSYDMLSFHIPGDWVQIVEQYKGAYDRWLILEKVRQETEQRSVSMQAIREEAWAREREEMEEYELKNAAGEVVYVLIPDDPHVMCSPSPVRSDDFRFSDCCVPDHAESFFLKSLFDSYPVPVLWSDIEQTRLKADRAAASLNKKICSLLHPDSKMIPDGEQLFILSDGRGAYTLYGLTSPGDDS